MKFFCRSVVLSALVVLFVCTISTATPLHIYIVAGQSNAVGVAHSAFLPLALQIPQEDVWIFTQSDPIYQPSFQNVWVLLQPGLGYEFGPEVTFGNGLDVNLPTQNIAIFKCAYGGTNLHTQWKAPDANGNGAGELYIEFMDYYDDAIAGLHPVFEPVVMGMTWMQGESDADTVAHANAYQQNLTEFINSLRSDLATPDMPFVIGKISDVGKNQYGNPMWPYAAIVRQAEQNVADSMLNVEVIETNDLPLWPAPLSLPWPPESPAHYDTNGIIEMGYRFADSILSMMNFVTLTGPNDGDYVDANGAVLSCEDVNDAISYQLLFGSTPHNLNYIVSDTNEPPTANISQFPQAQVYWTIKVEMASGATYSATPRLINAEVVFSLVENISTSESYMNIQDAIDDAVNGHTIVAGSYTFNENIDFLGKAIILRSIDPNDPNCVENTIISGSAGAPTVLFQNNETLSSVLNGITVTGGNDGIYCDLGEPTIKNCRMVSCGGRGIFMTYVPPNAGETLVSNCVIADNLSDGIYGYYCWGDTLNCTVVNNGGIGINGPVNRSDVKNCIVYGNNSGTIQADQILILSIATVKYSCVQGWTGGYSSVGNFSSDPCFADAGSGDYHLRSQAGRYRPLSNESDFNQDGSIDLADLGELASCWLDDCAMYDLNYSGLVNMADLVGFANVFIAPVFDGFWTRDSVTSLCIDAGDPADSYAEELYPNGSRINVGVYGNTSQAAKSP